MERIINSKKRKIIGYIIMIVGILMPLYSLTSISYNELKSSYHYTYYLKDNLSVEELEILEKVANDYNHQIDTNHQGIIDPFSYSEYKAQYSDELKGKDMIFGYLKIPKIDLTKGILLDATEEHLSKGLAHIDGTNLPMGGKGTRSVIAGHRGWYQDLMFLNLNYLENGDKIYLTTIFGKELSYTVTDKEIIAPYEWEKIKPIDGEDILTLLTCEPIYPNAPYRLIVNAKRDDPKENLDKKEVEIKESSSKKEAEVKENINEIESESNKNNQIILIKYFIYLTTVFLWGVIIFIIVKIIKTFQSWFNNSCHN